MLSSEGVSLRTSPQRLWGRTGVQVCWDRTQLGKGITPQSVRGIGRRFSVIIVRQSAPFSPPRWENLSLFNLLNLQLLGRRHCCALC